MSALAEILALPARSVTASRGCITIRFGTRDVRDLSDGQFPVEVWRCMDATNGEREDRHTRTVRLPHRLKAATSEAGRGACSRAVREWVEVRTPKSRATGERAA